MRYVSVQLLRPRLSLAICFLDFRGVIGVLR